MSAFSHYFKDFAIVYYVTMAPYNSKSSFEIRCLLGRARIESTRFCSTFIKFILSSDFPWLCCMLLIFLDVH